MKNVISYILFLLLLITGVRDSKAQTTKIICEGSSVTLRGPASIGGVKWFKDGTLIATTKDYVASSAGKYIVVAISEHGCESDASAPVDVVVSLPPLQPIATLVHPNCVINTGTIEVAVKSPDNTYSIDGITFQESNIFTGLSAGTYNIIAKNVDGCVSPTLPVTLVKEQPSGDFVASSTNISFGSMVNFTSTVAGAISYEWNFGDGGVSYDANPKHYYYKEGTFTVTLRVRTSGDCDFVITKTNYIKVGTDNHTPNIPVVVIPSGNDMSPVKVFAYPNPFKDKFNLSIASEIAQSVRVDMIDMKGNKVYSKDFQVSAGNNILTLDQLPTISQGVYTISVSGQGLKNSINILKI